MERKNNITSDRVYQDFEPVTRWVTEPGLDILLVSLPGFKKEQLRVQVTATRRLRLMGERLIGGNRWIRFRKEFPIQGNIDMDIISAKFEDGTLFVKHPRFKIQEPQREIHAEPRQQPPTETIDGQPQTQEITSQKQNTDIQQDRNPSKPVTDSQRENEKNKSKEKAMDSETDEENKSTEEKTNKLKEKYKEKLSGLVKEAQNQKQVVKEAQNGKQMVKESDNQKQVVMNLVAAILVVLLLLLSARNAVRSFIGISDD